MKTKLVLLILVLITMIYFLITLLIVPMDIDNDDLEVNLIKEFQINKGINKIDRNMREVKGLVYDIVKKLPRRNITKEQMDIISIAIYEASIRYENISPKLLCATITWETGRTWDCNSISPVGARGLMQIMPMTGAMLAYQEGIDYDEDILFDPEISIKLGTRYLSSLISSYGISGGLAAYNGGPSRGRQWFAGNYEKIKPETRSYVPGILKLSSNYHNFSL